MYLSLVYKLYNSGVILVNNRHFIGWNFVLVLLGSTKLKVELLMLERLRHPNILQFLGAVTKTWPPVVVTEYLPRVSLTYPTLADEYTFISV